MTNVSQQHGFDVHDVETPTKFLTRDVVECAVFTTLKTAGQSRTYNVSLHSLELEHK